jgi:hypothetical protein
VGAQFGTTLVYLLYLSDYCTGGDCAWAKGAEYNVMAQCLYLVAFILAGCLLGVEKRRREGRKNDDTEQDHPIPTTSTKTTGESTRNQDKEKNEKKKSSNWWKKNRHQKDNDDDDNDDASVSRAGTVLSVASGSPTEAATPMNERPPLFTSY